MKRLRERVNKENVKNLSKIIIFFLIASIPFISITNTVGMDTFIDSFENTDSYIFLENSKIISATKIEKPSYIIIQKINHPEFELKKQDEVMYCSLNGEILCNKIEQIQSIGSFKKFEIKNEKLNDNNEIIYKNQIIGKVVKVVDENIWNSLCLNFWNVAIENLNINSIF